MKTEEALAICEDTVRRFDPDRYFSNLFAPAPRRPLLFALYAFNHEIARVGGQSHDPMLGAIRLQWWRESLEQAREGRPRAHPVVVGLASLFASTGVPADVFETMLDAREFDLESDAFPDLAALECYCQATSSNLMRIADHVLNGKAGVEPFLKHAGVAYALAGLLRAIPFHAARRKIYLPLDLLGAESLSTEEIFAGRNAPSLRRVMRRLATRAREHVSDARGCAAGRSLVAALPGALVPVYLKRVARRDFDPFHTSSEVPLFRRQLALSRAAMFGRL